MRHVVSHQCYVKSIQVLSWFFWVCATLSKPLNSSDSGAWALNYLKNRRIPLWSTSIPNI